MTPDPFYKKSFFFSLVRFVLSFFFDLFQKKRVRAHVLCIQLSDPFRSFLALGLIFKTNFSFLLREEKLIKKNSRKIKNIKIIFIKKIQ